MSKTTRLRILLKKDVGLDGDVRFVRGIKRVL